MWRIRMATLAFILIGDGRLVPWCWVNFQFRGVLLIWIIVWQGPTALVVGAGGGGLDLFSLNPCFHTDLFLLNCLRYKFLSAP